LFGRVIDAFRPNRAKNYARSIVAMIASVLRFRRGIAGVDEFWRIYRENELVYAAVRELVRPFLTIPLLGERWNSKYQRFGLVEHTDPMQRLLDYPHPEYTRTTLFDRFLTSAYVTGNGLLQIIRAVNGKPLSLAPIDSGAVYPTIENGHIVYYVFTDSTRLGTGEAMKSFKLPPDSSRYFRLESHEVVHLILAPDPEYPLWGLSPISPALTAITAYDAINAYIIGFFQNGGVPPYAYVTKAEVTDDEIDRMKKRWNQQSGGVDQSWQVAVVDGTEGEFQRLGLAAGAREIGLHELAMDVESRVLAPLNVPPIMVGAVVGISHATYSNYNQAREAFYEESVDPMLVGVADVFTLKIAPYYPGTRRIRPDTSKIMALEDLRKSRSDRAVKEYQGGLTTKNESRAYVDRPPVDSGNAFMISVQEKGTEPALIEAPESGPVEGPPASTVVEGTPNEPNTTPNN
jgi:HK97 family phage portal protein